MISRRAVLAGLPALSTALGQSSAPPAPYDLLLRNGLVIDPKNNRHDRFDVGIAGGTIARVAPRIPAAHAHLVVDVGDYYVTPGLIDIHTHFDYGGADLNLLPDHHTLSNGVTTAVDAGSAGHQTFEEFQRRTIRRSKTRLLAWLNIVGAGMDGSEGSNLDAAACAATVKKNPDVVVGIQSTPDLLERAVEAGNLSEVPVMAAFHQPDGSAYPDFLKVLRPGDVQTQFYGRQSPLLDARKKIVDCAADARQRGILFDVGHGASGFWFRIAIPAIQQGFLPDTISTGIDRESILLPRANMMTTLSKFLNIGLTLEQAIERSTVAPARAIRRPELGHLGEGSTADVAVLELQNGKFGFVDSGHARLIGDRRLRCVLTVRNGRVVWDSEGLGATDWSRAGPYSNFK